MLTIYCVIYVCNIEAWVRPLMAKNSKTVLDCFIGMANESKREPIMS